eukprot:11332968-Alexandrium_andersonii.AAC.1
MREGASTHPHGLNQRTEKADGADGASVLSATTRAKTLEDGRVPHVLTPSKDQNKALRTPPPPLWVVIGVALQGKRAVEGGGNELRILSRLANAHGKRLRGHAEAKS